ncbi:hypothetical protein [Tautonia rosea]|uniref:hypothetical protein n=1 Tax=Tautonia rosea TaxID=2728037 RepID=UPI0014735290|nr:hypothetical protein [Tautonia rosea]
MTRVVQGRKAASVRGALRALRDGCPLAETNWYTGEDNEHETGLPSPPKAKAKARR